MNKKKIKKIDKAMAAIAAKYDVHSWEWIESKNYAKIKVDSVIVLGVPLTSPTPLHFIAMNILKCAKNAKNANKLTAGYSS